MVICTPELYRNLGIFFREGREKSEAFNAGYYRYHHPELKANPDQIDWDTDQECLDLLPTMQTDITLKKDGKTLIIDAKYYGTILQENFDVQTIRSANLYQIYTYVKNLDKNHTNNVAGMLLYAKTQASIQPDNEYVIGGNRIIVKTLDLDVPFAGIAEQLERIAETMDDNCVSSMNHPLCSGQHNIYTIRK